jgi:hypothetical protein
VIKLVAFKRAAERVAERVAECVTELAALLLLVLNCESSGFRRDLDGI